MDSATQSPLLLATKLAVPHLAKNLVQRTQLLQKICPASGMRPLTLICAPAGFGKTTALTSALEAQSHSVAWLSLDEGDNDPVTFVEYLIATSKSVFPDIVKGELALGKSRKLLSVEHLLSVLINEIAVRDGAMILVLDDFHYLNTKAVFQLFELLLAQQPRNLSIVLTSRCQPQVSLSRLRVQGRLTEIAEQDLRFSLDESKCFFQLSSAPQLTEEEMELLQQRTEGWVAGLQLAALSLQYEPDRAQFIRAFAGDDRFITDYLTEEVLRLYGDDVRDFLLQTSILARMNGTLCDAVIQGQGSQAMLERLESSDMFMIALDHNRQWFRYHHLFAELLQTQLARHPGLDVNALHRRAGRWFHENNSPHDAMHHALAAEDFVLALEVLEKHCQCLFSSGQNQLLIDWSKQIPPQMLKEKPKPLLGYVWAQFVGEGFLDGELLAILESAVSQDDPCGISLELQLLRGFEALQQRDAPLAIALGEHVLSAMEGNGVYQAAGLELQLGGAYYLADKITESYLAFERAWQRAIEHDVVVCMAGAIGGMSSCLKRLGRFDEAEKVVLDAFDVFVQHAAHEQLADDAWLYLGLAHISLWRGNIDQAEVWIDRAESSSACDFWDALIFFTPITRIKVLYGLGKMDEAKQLLTSIKDVDVRPPLLPLFPAPAVEYAELCLLLGDLGYARQYLQAAGFDVDAVDVSIDIERGHFYEHILLARFWAHSGHGCAAKALVTQLKTMAQQDGRAGDLLRLGTVLQTGAATSMVAGELLSEKERKVLMLLTQGFSNSDIAKRSFVSVNTVKTHLKNIYAKLGVESRVQAVDAARRLGFDV